MKTMPFSSSANAKPVHGAESFSLSGMEKVPVSLDRFGNTGGISIPLTLCDAYGGKSEGKKNALMCGFGIGLSWGVTNAVIDTDRVFPIIETEDYYADGKFVPGKY